MFTRNTSPQPVADQLKKIVGGVRSNQDVVRAAQAEALAALQIFERCDWRPAALEDAINQVAPERFTVSDDGRLHYVQIHTTTPTLVEGLGMLQAIKAVLDAYVRTVAPCVEPTP